MEAETGRAAVELAQAHRPDVILMDLRLPDADGVDVARELRSDALTSMIPVVALTAMALDGMEQWLEGAGFAGWIAKPIDVYWLGDPAGEARTLEPLLHAVERHCREGDDRDHRRESIGAQLTRHIDSVSIRQPQVHQDHVGAMRLRQFDRRATRFRFHRLKTVSLEQVAGELGSARCRRR